MIYAKRNEKNHLHSSEFKLKNLKCKIGMKIQQWVWGRDLHLAHWNAFELTIQQQIQNESRKKNEKKTPRTSLESQAGKWTNTRFVEESVKARPTNKSLSL